MAPDRLHLFGTRSLDLSRGVLLAGSEPVHLRPQAYTLLRYLAANPGRLIGKDELIEHIWQGRAVGDDSLVQCFRDVRQALGADGAAYIQTVRGRGYIFDPPQEAAPVHSPPVPLLPSTTPAAAAPGRPANERRGRTLGRHAAVVLAAGVVLVGGATAYRLADRADDPGATNEPRSLAAGYSPDNDAQLLYRRGRHQQQQTTEAGLENAIDLYSRAIALDPDLALAHAGLAESYRALAIVGHAPSHEAFPRAKQSALRALQLDDRLVEAHVALGWILSFHDWQWAEAETSLKRAIELDPRNAEAHRAYAHLLSNQGRHDEAIYEAARARELDPRALLTRALEAQFLFYGGRYDEAEARLRETLGMEPDYWVAHLLLGRIALAREQVAQAIEPIRKATALSQGAIEPTTQLAYALARSGQAEEARLLMRQLEQRSESTYVPAYAFAMIHNGWRDREAALRFLEQSVEAREVQATFVKIDTRWNWVRPDPRFGALLQRLQLK
jgi:DNA-binding winged helix-turn-helix (wHTH) protein/tetratricopeptide (TPR) repeat protein